MSYLQSVSIITALPIGIVIVMIAISFLKDIENSCKKYKSWVNYGENQERRQNRYGIFMVRR